MFSMKKRVLAVSVASALTVTAAQVGAHVLETNGIGMYNLVPYYTVQEGNSTVIHITNTDTINGKAVKVRFRGAEWSDDVFDFTLFLSPGDIWTGAVTQVGELAAMSTDDASCTLPASVNQSFITTRLEASANPAAGTREGYVEVITMADIPQVSFDVLDEQTYLYTAIKHVDGVAPCNAVLGVHPTNGNIENVLNNLEEDQGTAATLVQDAVTGPNPGDNKGQGMVRPTGSLMTYAVNINVPTSKAFTTQAPAVNPLGLTAGAERKIFFLQTNDPLAWDRDGDFGLTADLIFAPQNQIATDIGGTELQMRQFDMPDLTTPVLIGADALAHRNLMTGTLTRPTAVVEYSTEAALQATTDVVFNQPTRRFYYWFDQRVTDPEDRDYEIGIATDNKYDIIGEDVALATPPVAGQGDLYSTLNGTDNTIAVNDPDFWDREENRFDPDTDIVISPQPPTEIAPFFLVGEASVVSINDGDLPTGSLEASLTAFNYEIPLEGENGWVVLSTTGADGALPVIGFTAIKVFNGAVGAAGTNYGLTLPLKTP